MTQEIKQANILLYGLGCSGKSFSLATLFKLRDIRPEQRVVLLATEKNSLDGIRRGLAHYKIDLQPGQFYYMVVKPKSKKAFGAEIVALEKFAKDNVTATYTVKPESNSNKDKYTYFIDVVKGLHNLKVTDFVTKEEEVLGNIGELEEQDILIIDGLSPIVNGIWGLLQGDRKVNVIGDYQVVQKQLNDFTYELVNSIDCSLIMLAHADRLLDDIEKTEKLRVSLDCGVAMSGKYIGKFSDVIYSYSNTLTNKFVWTGKKSGVETAARNFPAEDNLVPDFSLYNFFKD